MNEEIEYAEMLEIPVSTINLVRKKKKQKRAKADLKEDLIAQVNERMQYIPPEPADLAAQAGVQSGAQEPAAAWAKEIEPSEQIPPVFSLPEGDAEGVENAASYDDGAYTVSLPAAKEKQEKRRPFKLTGEHIITAEFAAACVLCGAIFLTNVFLPNSAINTFFRSFSPTETAAEKNYFEFDMQSVLGELTQGEIELSPTGVLTVTAKGCIYPALDGRVTGVTEVDGATWEMRVGYTGDFYGVISGLDEVYYAEGDKVKANIPVGYSDGEGVVTVSLYADGTLLNCFTLDENGCPVWNENAP